MSHYREHKGDGLSESRSIALRIRTQVSGEHDKGIRILALVLLFLNSNRDRTMCGWADAV